MQTGAAKWSYKQELPKEVIKRSRTKELHIGAAKGIANLGCKKKFEKELETEIAERSCEMQSQKDDVESCDADEAGNVENNLF